MRAYSFALVALALAPHPAFALFGNLSAGSTPPGWTSGAVPRNTGDAAAGSATLPAQLDALTWFNWSVWQNAGLSGTWRDEFWIDGELVQLVTRSNLTFAARYWLELNTGPIYIEGGRHALEIHADPDWTSNEDFTNRGDNVFRAAYLWKPPALAAGSGTVTAPPEGSLDSPGVTSCNAFEFTRTPGTAWIVSLGQGPADPGCALAIYDDYVNSTTGLSHEIGRSALAPSANFVVGADAGVAPVLYPAVVRPAGSTEAQVDVAVADASGRQSANGVGLWPSVNLPAGHSAQVFEAHLAAGDAESALLARFMGRSDLELRIYPPGVTAASRDQATWVSTPRDGDDEYDDFAFTPPTTGWYLFVVARVDGQFFDDTMGYRLELVANGTVGAAPAIAAAPLAAAPSPAIGPMRLSFALAQPERVTLDVFDLAGRAVRRLADESLPAGPHARVWDGRDDRGASVAPGRYWARLTAGSRRESVSVLRIH